MTTDNYQPFSIEAEQVVLAALLTGNRYSVELMESITEEDLYSHAHKLIFRAAARVWSRAATIDVVSVINALGSDLEGSGGLGYIAELASHISHTVNPTSCIAKIKDKKAERDVLDIADRMRREIMRDGDDSLTRINNALALPMQYDTTDVTDKEVGAMLLEAMNDLQFRHTNGGKITGVETGFADLDDKLQGMQPGQLLIIAARPAMGKTTLALNLFEHSELKSEYEKATIFFSLEMPGKEVCEKMISSIGGIDHGLLKKGLPMSFSGSQEAWPKITPAFQRLKLTRTMVIDERSALNVQQIRAKCIKVKKKHGGAKAVFIDYLTYIKTPGRDNRVLEVGAVSRSLKAMAKELECPIICLAQLSRKCEERADKRPLLSDLRDSGEIEQDADCIMFIYRDEYYNPDSLDKGIAEVSIAKNRSGETGTIRLYSDLSHSRFRSLDRSYEEIFKEREQMYGNKKQTKKGG